VTPHPTVFQNSSVPSQHSASSTQSAKFVNSGTEGGKIGSISCQFLSPGANVIKLLVLSFRSKTIILCYKTKLPW
jgi:hypothetical protein